MGGPRRLAARLVPNRERGPVTRELEEIATSRGLPPGSGRTELWYVWHLLAFAVRLRVERARQALGECELLARELVLAMRNLRRRPAYVAAAVLTLGVGTGGLATVYGAAHWVLLRDVPGVEAPGEMVQLSLESSSADWGGNSWGVMHADVLSMRERMPSLTGLEAATSVQVHLTAAEGAVPSRQTASMVTAGYFDLLGLRPAAGRFFMPSEHADEGGPREVVIGHELWRSRWNAGASAIGARVEINRRAYVVIGVAPAGFHGAQLPGDSDLWLAASAYGDLFPADADDGILEAIQLWDRLLGRRRPGASLAQVAAEAKAAMEAIRTERAGQRHSFMAEHFVLRTYDGIGLAPDVRPHAERTLAILSVGSLVLLAIVIANVANLGLTRAASRRGSSAIRRALGAGTLRVSREPLLEGLLLGTLGGAVGLALARLGRGVFAEARLSARGGSLEGMVIDWPVVAVAFATAVAAGLLSGLLPALMLARERSLEWLQGARRGGSPAARSRSLLVAGQIALAATLLVTAGLFARTLLNVSAIYVGVQRDAFVFSLDPGADGRDAVAARELLHRVQRAVRDRFGTSAVGVVFPSPLLGYRITGGLSLPEQEDSMVHGSSFWTSGNGFFEAVGMRRLAGPGFDQELAVADPVERPVAINERMAAALFPGMPAATLVGREVVIRGEDAPSTLVAVIADARLASPLSEAGPILFRPYDAGWSSGSAVFALNSGLGEGPTVEAVRELVRGVDPHLPVYDAGTAGRLIDVRLTEQRVVGRLATVLGVVSLVLMMLSLYGLLSHVVHERTHEIGVRSALGASGSDLRLRVVGRGLRLTAGGLLVGTPLAWWLTRTVESRLYGVSVLDPATYAVGLTAIVTVAVAASWLPALHATRVSPVEALRVE